MSAMKPTVSAPKTVTVGDPDDSRGRLKDIGGSQSDRWNHILAMQALWTKNSSPEERDKQLSATVAALSGIAPKDELEGMMAAQLVAAHNAAMECYRRAMIGEQTFEGRRENLAQANKLSRTYAALLEAPNRHRGKGQQKVTVEHVHVHAGGQAVAGMVASSPGRPGGGITTIRRNYPMQSRSPMHLSPRCGARTRAGTSCRSPAMANGRCRMHGGKAPGAPPGNSHAFRHGRYSAQAVAERRKLMALVRDMKGLVEQADGEE
jgi:hypothetical protein